MQIAITDLMLRNLKPPQSGRLVIHDTKSPAVLRVTSAGTATWSVSVRTKDGKRTQPTLGRWPAMGVGAARKAALATLTAIHQGGDPVAERRTARAEREARATLPTVAQLLADWQTAKASRWSTRYQSEVRRLCQREIVLKLGKRLLVETTRRDWTTMIAAVHRRAPGVGNMLYKACAAFLNDAEARGLIPAPLLPRKGMAFIAPAVDARERVLSNDEVKAVWDATSRLTPKPRCFVRLLLLTGCRRAEAANISIAEVHMANCTWSIPGSRTKNGRGYTVPLNDTLLADLRAVMPAHNRAPSWKLLGGVPGSGLAGFGRAKAIVDRWSGVTAWRWHDLRRTCRSGLSAIGIAPDIAERALNHISHASQLQRIYDRHSYGDEIIAALSRWQAHVAALVTDAPRGADVVSLRRAG
jgi:integrase